MTIFTRERGSGGATFRETEDAASNRRTERTAEAAAAIESAGAPRPRVGIILGSGLGGVADAVEAFAPGHVWQSNGIPKGYESIIRRPLLFKRTQAIERPHKV